MENNAQTTGRGVGVLGLLQVAFIILKIVHLIDWSWWLVFLPTWIGIGAVVIFLAVCTVIIVVKEIREAQK